MYIIHVMEAYNKDYYYAYCYVGITYNKYIVVDIQDCGMSYSCLDYYTITILL